MDTTKQHQNFADELEQKFGKIVGGTELTKLLGYPSTDAFRQAMKREQLPIDVFSIPHRRGYFAYCRDVAQRLENLPKK